MKKEKIPNPYRIDRFAGIPAPVKAVFIKFWFAGPVFFFIVMGMESLVSIDQLDLVLVLGAGLGLITDLLVNNIFRYMQTDTNDMDVYMVFPKKNMTGFVCNILYGILMSMAISYTYNAINLLAIANGTVSSDEVFLPTEPLLYGVFFVLYDFSVLGIKYIVRRIFKKPQE